MLRHAFVSNHVFGYRLLNMLLSFFFVLYLLCLVLQRRNVQRTPQTQLVHLMMASWAEICCEINQKEDRLKPSGVLIVSYKDG
jgi:hypothetical protein